MRDFSLAGASPATRRSVGMLTHFALNQLWAASPEAIPGDLEQLGCCPDCCAPCGVLRELARSGDLDAWVRAWPDDLSDIIWWDETTKTVRRDWLAASWANVAALQCCHEQSGDEEPADALDR